MFARECKDAPVNALMLLSRQAHRLEAVVMQIAVLASVLRLACDRCMLSLCLWLLLSLSPRAEVVKLENRCAGSPEL